jgi:hypothetical protein
MVLEYPTPACWRANPCQLTVKSPLWKVRAKKTKKTKNTAFRKTAVKAPFGALHYYHLPGS